MKPEVLELSNNVEDALRNKCIEYTRTDGEVTSTYVVRQGKGEKEFAVQMMGVGGYHYKDSVPTINLQTGNPKPTVFQTRKNGTVNINEAIKRLMGMIEKKNDEIAMKEDKEHRLALFHGACYALSFCLNGDEVMKEGSRWRGDATIIMENGLRFRVKPTATGLFQFYIMTDRGGVFDRDNNPSPPLGFHDLLSILSRIDADAYCARETADA